MHNIQIDDMFACANAFVSLKHVCCRYVDDIESNSKMSRLHMFAPFVQFKMSCMKSSHHVHFKKG